MKLAILLWLSTPISWLIGMMIVVACTHLFPRARTRQEDPSRIVRVGPTSPDSMGAALMFLSMAYRPNHAFVAKAQIQQHEDEDEDDQGGPDTPQRHLHRQLRRIRRGEQVDRLVWRLE
jgi:hypothetical protein